MSVNGPWLNNQHNNLRDAPWRTYGKLADMVAPGPSGLWVLVDEDTAGLNDGAFAVGMEKPVWFDAPGTYHNGGCGFAFGDGHTESHRWSSTAGKRGHRFVITAPQDRADWFWMRERTSVLINGSMPVVSPW
jgi:prepilin-type processing-associated H-X9-DG protein